MARRRSGLIFFANRQRSCRQGISTSRPHFGNDGCEHREPTGPRPRCARVRNAVEQSRVADNEYKNNDSAGAPQSRHLQVRQADRFARCVHPHNLWGRLNLRELCRKSEPHCWSESRVDTGLPRHASSSLAAALRIAWRRMVALGLPRLEARLLPGGGARAQVGLTPYLGGRLLRSI
jgi:hypothetical protein